MGNVAGIPVENILPQLSQKQTFSVRLVFSGFVRISAYLKFLNFLVLRETLMKMMMMSAGDYRASTMTLPKAMTALIVMAVSILVVTRSVCKRHFAIATAKFTHVKFVRSFHVFPEDPNASKIYAQSNNNKLLR